MFHTKNIGGCIMQEKKSIHIDIEENHPFYSVIPYVELVAHNEESMLEIVKIFMTNQEQYELKTTMENLLVRIVSDIMAHDEKLARNVCSLCGTIHEKNQLVMIDNKVYCSICDCLAHEK